MGDGFKNTEEKVSFMKLHSICTARKCAFKALDTQYSVIPDKEYYWKIIVLKWLMQVTLEGILRLLLLDLSQSPKVGD